MSQHHDTNRDISFAVITPPCRSCTHLLRSALPGRRICSAFPNGIPDQIWAANHLHRTPYPGDHGIRYEPLPADALPAAEVLSDTT